MSDAVARRGILEQALSKRGLVIRADSSLCKSFIEGTLDASYTPEAVTQLCGLHKFLYEYTNYSQRCASILPAIANALSSSLGSYDAAWNYVVTTEAPIIKCQVLRENPVPVDKWPWEETESDSTTSTSNNSDTASEEDNREQIRQQIRV
jgi:hypothetical protein